MRVKERLMIPRKTHGLSATVDAIAIIADRVIHQHGTYPSIVDIEHLRFGQSPKIKRCGQLGFRDRKIRMLKLDLEYVFDASPGSILRATVHTALGCGIKQRCEHRQAIDVIPMTVGDQQMGVDRLWTLQGLTQRENPRSRIKNQQSILVSADLNTGGITPISGRLCSWGCD
jgi:hypothetical protein